MGQLKPVYHFSRSCLPAAVGGGQQAEASTGETPSAVEPGGALDHPAVHEAKARYTRSVRPDAPWCPDNVEFIRRVNDLDARADVFDVVTAATYLVVGLGDVYLGAPVAVPVDPRH
ncbi:MAG: carboxyltransferase domain-containing protein, partial [Acidimicrobiales bacterium]|nr:carboxyltransferase domain-containing protein [Acidimicrobiales bacterium]